MSELPSGNILIRFKRPQGNGRAAMELTPMALMRRLASGGYYPYRLGLPAMAGAEPPGAYSDLLRDIKNMLDPAGILAPGRYVGAERVAAEALHPRVGKVSS